MSLLKELFEICLPVPKTLPSTRELKEQTVEPIVCDQAARKAAATEIMKALEQEELSDGDRAALDRAYEVVRTNVPAVELEHIDRDVRMQEKERGPLFRNRDQRLRLNIINR